MGAIIEVLEEGKRKVAEDPEAGISEISGPLENKLEELGKKLMKKTLEDKEKEIKQSNKKMFPPLEGVKEMVYIT